MSDDRPNPDELLKRTQAADRAEGRGQLKIYLGMAAGVGKTFAMLNDAIAEAKNGLRVVAGYIEPHGRAETETLAHQLPRVPYRTIEYRGVTLREFDLDEALKEKPDIILVDELAHTNVPGSRHVKRYQDIEELCAKGITVWTTLNVQHIESLKDVVANITGVEVVETVPDAVVAQASEIELVDIPPDELIQRLEAGKIYSPDKVGAALKNFFKKGNLVALREIVLRRAADTVDAQLRSFRTAEGVRDVWATNPRVLVSVAPTPFAPRLVRSAIRLAKNLKAPLVAVTVETPRTKAASEKDVDYGERALESAERAGAEIVRTAGEDVVGEIIKVARQTNATIVIAGKPMRSRWREIVFGSIVDDLIRRSGKIDVHVVQGSAQEASDVPMLARSAPSNFRSVVETAIWVTVATLLCFAVAPMVAPANLVMLYLLCVSWVAFRYGHRESLLASIVSVLAFDFFFVPPEFTFAVSDFQYLITFAVMLLVSLLISSLSLRLKAQSEVASEREHRSSMLLHFSKQLAGCRSEEEVATKAHALLRSNLQIESAAYWPEVEGGLKALNSTKTRLERDQNEIAVASWVSDRKLPAGKNTSTLPGAKGYFIPLEHPGERVPVWAVFLGEDVDSSLITTLNGLALIISGALRRLTLEKEASEANYQRQQEELRNVLLSSVSHDLRTPLTAICGAASTLLEEKELPQRSRQLASTIVDSSTRLALMVRNILDLSRLETGGLKLNFEWHALDEIIAVALRRTEGLLAGKAIDIQIPDTLPLLYVDGLLLEQLFVNLLENIARHAATASRIEIAASKDEEDVAIVVADNGPGLRPGSEREIFEKLSRGESSQGFGLGLAICKAIVRAHSGTISAANRPEGGARFIVTLPFPKQQPELP